MNHSLLRRTLLCALLLPALACQLLDTSNSENSQSGRGARVFDPYQASASGNIRLSLQMFNGCAVLPNSQMVAKTSAIPDGAYPTTCATLLANDPTGTLTPPTGKLTLVAGTNYFLNQLTITDSVVNKHTNPADISDAVRWFKTQSTFKGLDWDNLGQIHDEWIYGGAVPGVVGENWIREVQFGNANWQKAENDTFTIEVLDAAGVVRTSATYNRDELLASTAYAGHSRIAWRMEGVRPPRFPGDTEIQQITAKPGAFPQPPTFRTLMRMDLVGSTNPFKSFRIGDLRGDGALRVTWSQMKDRPFYWPVTFVAPTDLPPTCEDDAGNKKACGFGLDPQLEMVAPKNGDYYEPGETLNMVVVLRDNDGNRLHPKDTIPSAAEITTDQANGILSFVPQYYFHTLETDAIPMSLVAGPIHLMTVRPTPYINGPFYTREFTWPMVEDAANFRIVPGLYSSKTNSRLTIKLPSDVKPGTYVAYVKANRYFMGERVSKMSHFFFQVKQKEVTRYPDQVGNCQICHRGVLSLDNLRHGGSVDHVEGCKGCHAFASDLAGRMEDFVHRIHMNSPRFKVEKNDCRFCHLTKESATRPSIGVCNTCHPSAHGDKYFQMAFSAQPDQNRHVNCAESCHSGDQTPKNHILPEL